MTSHDDVTRTRCGLVYLYLQRSLDDINGLKVGGLFQTVASEVLRL